MSTSKTYTFTKPVAENAIGSVATAHDLKPLGGVERLLELQAIRDTNAPEGATPAVADEAVEDTTNRAGKRSRQSPRVQHP